MSTSGKAVPATRWRTWVARIADAHAARHARIASAISLPDLLARLGQRYAGRARRRHIHLELEIDPALETDLVGPYAALGAVVEHLIAHAIDASAGDRVTLRVDVVGDEPGRQTVHFAVDYQPPREGTSPLPDAWRMARQRLEAVGGTLHVELENEHRAIAELRFIVPPRPPHVNVVALRKTLGSDAALYDVIEALGQALAADVGHLEGALQREDAPAVRQWLHRVSGALGMAEATGLAAMGVSLEEDMAVRSLDDMALAVRRFAMDATRALAWLREGPPHEPLL